MARAARQKSESGIYAVILKGKGNIFISDDDYEEFISKLDSSAADILGFGLISGYAFLCIKESPAGLSADVRSIIISYARYYNKKYNTAGKLFDGRFKSLPLASGAETDNCIRLVQDAVNITGKDGYTSVGGDGEYEMIPFFAAAMGVKTAPEKKPERPKRKRGSSSEPKTKRASDSKTRVKNEEAENRSTQANIETEAHTAAETDVQRAAEKKSRTAAETETQAAAETEEQKPQKKLPSWLL